MHFNTQMFLTIHVLYMSALSNALQLFVITCHYSDKSNLNYTFKYI